MKRLLLLAILCAAIVPASTAAVTRLPMTVVRTWLTVEAEIDGRNCRLLVDTGSPSTLLSARTAAALGIAGSAATAVGTSDGTPATMQRAVVGRMVLGDRLLTGLRVLIAADTVLDCFGIDGIIGGDILRRYVVRFSLRDGYVMLADRLSEAGAVERKHSARMRLSANKSYLRCHLYGAKGRYPAWMLFDTGADGLCLGEWERLHSRGALTDLHMAEGYAVSSGLMGSSVARHTAQVLAVVPQLRFAGVDICNMTMKSGFNWIIGASVLKWGDVVADYHGRRIYYVAGEESVAAGGGGVEAFNIYPAFDAARGVVVGSVWDENLAGRVQAGDRIVCIDGMPADSMTVCDFYSVAYKVGQTRFTIESADGEMQHITMNIIE